MYCISFSVYMPQVVYTHALLTSQGLYLFPAAAAAEFVNRSKFFKAHAAPEATLLGSIGETGFEGFHSHGGTPIAGCFFFMEILFKWMVTGGYPHFRKLT